MTGYGQEQSEPTENGMDEVIKTKAELENKA